MTAQKNDESLTEKISALFEKKETDTSWSFSEYGRTETSKWTHGYHRYPAKFIPQLVERLMSENLTEKRAHINDPFFGSGTTIVSALSKGYEASGTDINGIAFLITKVKSTPLEPNYLSKKVEEFLGKIKLIDSHQTTLIDLHSDSIIPEKHRERIDYWFHKEMTERLGTILWHIKQEIDEDIRDFLLVAFSQILKNCSIWLQKSTKPTRDFKKIPSNPYAVIKRHLRKMVRGNKQFFTQVPDEVKENLDSYLNIRWGDARKQSVESNSVDMIISSSPYVTSYEYADLHQLSTIWFDYTEDLRKYKSKFIGSAFDNSRSKEALRSEIGKGIVHKFESISKKLREEVESFFRAMEQVFDEGYRVLKPGGRCCFVIGNTRLRGVDILNAQVFAESIQHSGFLFEHLIKREIPSKILPQTRDEKTGRFASTPNATSIAYPVEYIVIGRKDT